MSTVLPTAVSVPPPPLGGGVVLSSLLLQEIKMAMHAVNSKLSLFINFRVEMRILVELRILFEVKFDYELRSYFCCIRELLPHYYQNVICRSCSECPRMCSFHICRYLKFDPLTDRMKSWMDPHHIYNTTY